MAGAPRFQIEQIRFHERDVVLRLPFRFGAATVTACPQVYASVRIRLADGSTAEGCAAEMMVPKWFDKNPALSHEQNFQQLRDALALARAAYLLEAAPHSAWGHFAIHYAAILKSAAEAGLNPLAASYGPALIDRAVLDALCLHQGCGFAAAMAANLPGITLAGTALAPDLNGFDMDAFLARQVPRRRIAARHTVGLADAIHERDRGADAVASARADGLPASLEAAIERYGHRHFKIKLSGDTRADLARLQSIASLIDPLAELVTLDGNEQYADARAFADFLDELSATPGLARLQALTAFVEQPIRRDQALQPAHSSDVRRLARRTALLVDESDATLGAFVQARALGYTGVSSKSCKGFYKSVINAARCALWNSQEERQRFFLSGEDLTLQAGVGVQQDLALVGWLGLAHVERNGHHYVNGMAALPPEEQQALLQAHPTLYEHSHGAARLRIHGGAIDLSSLDGPGFATGQPGAGISWNAMRSTY